MRWLARHRVTALVVVAGVVAVLGAAWLGRNDRTYSVAPGPELVRQLGVASFPATTTLDGPVAAGCPAYDGLTVRVAVAETYRTDGCFRGHGGVILAQPRSGLTLVGGPALLTNDQILE